MKKKTFLITQNVGGTRIVKANSVEDAIKMFRKSLLAYSEHEVIKVTEFSEWESECFIPEKTTYWLYQDNNFTECEEKGGEFYVK